MQDRPGYDEAVEAAGQAINGVLLHVPGLAEREAEEVVRCIYPIIARSLGQDIRAQERKRIVKAVHNEMPDRVDWTPTGVADWIERELS